MELPLNDTATESPANIFKVWKGVSGYAGKNFGMMLKVTFL
jgi:hypothetical protein